MNQVRNDLMIIKDVARRIEDARNREGFRALIKGPEEKKNLNYTIKIILNLNGQTSIN